VKIHALTSNNINVIFYRSVQEKMFAIKTNVRKFEAFYQRVIYQSSISIQFLCLNLFRYDSATKNELELNI